MGVEAGRRSRRIGCDEESFGATVERKEATVGAEGHASNVGLRLRLAYRAGPAFPLWVGSAQNACERGHWYELAPALIRGGGVTTGVSVFRNGESRPENLERWLPTTGEIELARQHQTRIDRAESARRRAAHWNLFG